MLDVIVIFKALADETRYHLVKMLLGHDYCVGALAKKLGISESAVSQHLKILRQAGLVKGDKRGYFTHYSVERGLLKEAATELNKLADLARMNSECPKLTGANRSYCRKEEKPNG
ncbi:MAG: winged helix-turn-helix transcriptional regulator [Firmicutes bacterium]|nr:winged helix-turn-helix transcriptional regulator [Bacillota bacterium]